MARDNRLLISFPSASSGTNVLATTTAGVVTLSGTASFWAKGVSTALNLGGSTFYAAASGPVPPATETAGSGSSTLNGNMGCEAYIQCTVAASALTNSPSVTVFVEGASDSAGSAGTDWAPISGGMVVNNAGLTAKRVNLQLIDTTKPWVRLVVQVLHGGTAAGGTVTITQAGFSLGRDGVNTAG